MKKTLICMLVAASMLGACSQQATPPDAGTARHAATEGAKPGSKGAHKEGNVQLLDGYRPSFKYKLRTDKIGTGKDGKPVRRVVLEYIGIDQAKLVTMLDRDLKRHGYSPKAWRQDDGRTSTQYVKKGAARLGVTISPATAAQPTRAPGAQGFVKFVWVVAP